MAGLFSKYKIEKTDGSAIDPEAKYFVLRYDTDSSARVALVMYALHQSDPQLQQELLSAIKTEELKAVKQAWRAAEIKPDAVLYDEFNEPQAEKEGV